MSVPGTTGPVQTIEERIVAEWGVIRAWVALHPYSTMVIIAVVAAVGSHIFWH